MLARAEMQQCGADQRVLAQIEGVLRFGGGALPDFGLTLGIWQLAQVLDRQRDDQLVGDALYWLLDLRAIDRSRSLDKASAQGLVAAHNLVKAAVEHRHI